MLSQCRLRKQSGPIKYCPRRNHVEYGTLRRTLEVGWVETGSKDAENPYLPEQKT